MQREFLPNLACNELFADALSRKGYYIQKSCTKLVEDVGPKCRCRRTVIKAMETLIGIDDPIIEIIVAMTPMTGYHGR